MDFRPRYAVIQADGGYKIRTPDNTIMRDIGGVEWWCRSITKAVRVCRQANKQLSIERGDLPMTK